jgi:hypothetical protein
MAQNKPKDLEELRKKLENLKPGEFLEQEILNEARGRPSDWKSPSEEETYKNSKPTFSDSLIAEYELFRDNIYSPKRVLYPSCDLDPSVIRAFPDAQVDLVDINQHVVEVLRRNGIEAIHSDIKDYKPRELYDLLILLNPGYESNLATPFVASNGYIMANNWHGNATQLVENSNFRSIGTIQQIPTKKVDGEWQHDYKLVLDEMEGLGKVSDNFWIFRRNE